MNVDGLTGWSWTYNGYLFTESRRVLTGTIVDRFGMGPLILGPSSVRAHCPALNQGSCALWKAVSSWR